MLSQINLVKDLIRYLYASLRKEASGSIIHIAMQTINLIILGFLVTLPLTIPFAFIVRPQIKNDYTTSHPKTTFWLLVTLGYIAILLILAFWFISSWKKLSF